MKFYIDFWWKIGFVFEIWRYQIETKDFMYISTESRFMKYRLGIHIYKTSRGWLLYNINLPFFKLMNNRIQKVVSDDDGRQMIVPVVSGKILLWKIKI